MCQSYFLFFPFWCSFEEFSLINFGFRCWIGFSLWFLVSCGIVLISVLCQISSSFISSVLINLLDYSTCFHVVFGFVFPQFLVLFVLVLKWQVVVNSFEYFCNLAEMFS
jgi:hypothetical protein